LAGSAQLIDGLALTAGDSEPSRGNTGGRTVSNGSKPACGAIQHCRPGYAARRPLLDGAIWLCASGCVYMAGVGVTALKRWIVRSSESPGPVTGTATRWGARVDLSLSILGQRQKRTRPHMRPTVGNKEFVMDKNVQPCQPGIGKRQDYGKITEYYGYRIFEIRRLR
jgi:hypothetical protein